MDSYWLVGDRSYDQPPLTGSLADDFTDIYCDVQPGLELASESAETRELVLGQWRLSYDCHWAQHLSDALRYLEVMAICRRLGQRRDR